MAPVGQVKKRWQGPNSPLFEDGNGTIEPGFATFRIVRGGNVARKCGWVAPAHPHPAIERQHDWARALRTGASSPAKRF